MAAIGRDGHTYVSSQRLASGPRWAARSPAQDIAERNGTDAFAIHARWTSRVKDFLLALGSRSPYGAPTVLALGIQAFGSLGVLPKAMVAGLLGAQAGSIGPPLPSLPLAFPWPRYPLASLSLP